MLIAIVHKWVICQVYCSQTIKLSVRSVAEVATNPERTGPDRIQILLFFRGSGSDPNPVLFGDADQDLNLALPF